jgi:hypothetical protein
MFDHGSSTPIGGHTQDVNDTAPEKPSPTRQHPLVSYINDTL